MKRLLPLGMVVIAIHAFAADCGSGARAYGFEAVYTADLLANVRGGIRHRAAYLDNLDLKLNVDGERALGWSNTCLFAYGLYNNGARFSEGIVGDSQDVSNIETDVRALRLFEAWVDHGFLDRRASLRAGLYDLNSEFDHVYAAELFLNSAQGIGTDFSQTGENGPSIFPVTSLALRAAFAPRPGIVARIAVLDAVPGDPSHPARTTIRFGQGALLVGEADIGGPSRRAGFGYWHYTEAFQDIGSGASGRGNSGWYVLGETLVAGGEARGVSAFVRFGRAPGRFNQYDAFLGAGVVWRGAVTGNPDDVLGFALARAATGSPFRAATGAATNETDLELSWSLQLSEAVSIQPDIQYVIHPNADPALGNALVFGVRGIFALAHF